MKQVAQIWTSNSKFFPSPNDVVVIYAKFEGTAALPDMKALIENCLRRMGLTFTTETYVVKHPGEPRKDEHGTAFVDGGSKPRPTLYLEDRPLKTALSSSTWSSDRSLGDSKTSLSKEVAVTSGASGQYTYVPADAPSIYQSPTSRFTNPIFPRAQDNAPSNFPPTSVTSRKYTSFSNTSSTQVESSRSLQVDSSRAPINSSLSGGEGEMVPKQESKYSGLELVISRLDTQTSGARLVRRHGQWIRIPAKDWRQGTIEGKSVLICDKLKIFTHPSLVVALFALSETGWWDLYVFALCTSLGAVAVLVSYYLTIGCIVYRRLSGRALPARRWSLGSWGLVINLAALGFLTPLIFFLTWPLATPVTAATMNWSSVMLVGTLIIAMIYYVVWARKEYVGPVMYVQRED